MKITKRKFNRLRTAVSRMDGFHFTTVVYRTCFEATPYIEQFFDDCNPYGWLWRQGIAGLERASLEDYRDYCVRWLDHVKKDMCV
jgi:hypothetical protein